MITNVVTQSLHANVGKFSRGFSRIVGCLVMLAGLYAPSIASAQVDAGSLQGTVADSTGASIPGALVKLHDEKTGFDQQTHTDSGGNYSFAPLRIGTYTLTVTQSGFDTVERTHLTVSIQQQLSVPITLKAGSVSQSVEVSSSEPILQTLNGSVGQVVEEKQINDLPLNGRNYFFLAQLAPGVTFGQQDTRGENSNGRFATNGLRPGQNDYLLDGIDNNSSIISNQNGKDFVIKTPVDALSEFKVQTNNYSAEFGRAAGAVLNATIKSGTNRLHGDVWEFIRNEALDANDYFSGGKKRAEFRRNQFGFTIGGPVVLPKIYNGHDRTFFFADYEGLRQLQGNPIPGVVPTVAERDSNFTDLSDLVTLNSGVNPADAFGRVYPLGTVFDPATTRTIPAHGTDPVTGLVNGKSSSIIVREPFPGNQIPANRIDPNAVKLLMLLPPPTNTSLKNNYATTPIYTDNDNSFDIRIDQYFGKNDILFGRYSYNNHNQVHPGVFGTYQQGYADGGNSAARSNFNDRAQNISIGYTHTFNSRLVNSLRVGVNREHVLFLQPNGNTMGIPAQFGIQGVQEIPLNGGLPQLTVGGITAFGANGFLPSNKYGTTPQINDDLTWVHGSHTIKIGYEQQRVIFPYLQPGQSRGAFGFNGEFTSVYGQTDANTGRAQFLLAPTASSKLAGANSVSESNFVEHNPIQNYVAGYVQDGWSATSRLTLNIGLRYDHYDFLHDRKGTLADFVMGPGRVGGTYLVTPTVAPLVPANFATALGNEGITVKTKSGALINAQNLNFSPRLGFADRVTDKFVVRGGFGLFFGGIENIGGSPLITGTFPNDYTLTRTAVNAATPITPDNSIGLLETSLVNLALNPASADPAGVPLIGIQENMKTAYAEAYNLALEYQLNSTMALTVSYVGSVARHLEFFLDPNSVGTLLPPGTTTAGYLPYKTTASSGNFYTIPGGSTNFNGLQVNLEKRVSHGLTFLTNFAYQKAFTTGKENLENDTGAFRAPFLPGFGLGADYKRTDFDVKRVFHFSGIYDLPYGRGRTWGGNANRVQQAALGGWSLNLITAVQDGQPFTVACATTTAAGAGCNANLVPGVNPYKGSSVAHFLNAAAFKTPAAVTTIGQSDYSPLGSKPTQVSGPPFRRLDMSLFKKFNFSESIYAEFRFEVFNVTNTANFAQPGSLNYASPGSFAQITATRDSPNDPREIQLGAKVYW